jgi:rubrerythrin
MHIAREYDTAPQANAAAKYLIEHGIVAGVVYSAMRRRELEPGLGIHRPSHGVFRVLLSRTKDAEDARLLLDDFDTQALNLPDNWEDEAEPDLARLAPEHAPTCPRCAATLPAQAHLEHCPTCQHPVDVPMLIAAQHGPEVLAELVPEAEADEWIDADLLIAVDLPCLNCRYGLAGLPPAGLCPECGTPYDKRAMLERLFAAGR